MVQRKNDNIGQLKNLLKQGSSSELTYPRGRRRQLQWSKLSLNGPKTMATKTVI